MPHVIVENLLDLDFTVLMLVTEKVINCEAYKIIDKTDDIKWQRAGSYVKDPVTSLTQAEPQAFGRILRCGLGTWDTTGEFEEVASLSIRCKQLALDAFSTYFPAKDLL